MRLKQCDLIVQSVGKIQKRLNEKISRTSVGKTVILSNCAICDSKTSKLIKIQEANGLLSSFGIKTPLGKFPLVGPPLF